MKKLVFFYSNARGSLFYKVTQNQLQLIYLLLILQSDRLFLIVYLFFGFDQFHLLSPPLCYSLRLFVILLS